MLRNVNPMNQTPTKELCVSPEEQGVKLLRFLEYRLENNDSKAMLHKWIRSGQVRINGKRSKPFDTLLAGDLIRIPPFAVPKIYKPVPKAISQERKRLSPEKLPSPLPLGQDLPIIAATEKFMILGKPVGLAVQGGSSLQDSITHRLRSAYADSAFVPAAVHRLDRQSSGLVVVGRTQHALQELSAIFACTDLLEKYYLAVVKRHWPYTSPMLLLDQLGKITRDNFESMGTLFQGRTAPLPIEEDTGSFLEHLIIPEEFNSCAIATPLKQTVWQNHPVSLLRIQLITGRKHQIRVQLSSRGFAILGDTRYGGLPAEHLFLHAQSIKFPDGQEYSLEPEWLGLF